MDISLEWDSRDLDVWRNHQVDRSLTRAFAKAGAEALRALKSTSTRSVRAKKRLKVRRVQQGLPVFYPANKTELNDLVWRMDVSGAPVPLVEFPHREVNVRSARGKRRGVKVAVNATSGPKLIGGIFKATMQSGHTGLFSRRGREQLPIDEAYSTRISDVFNDTGMLAKVQLRTGVVLATSFSRNLKIELDKIK